MLKNVLKLEDYIATCAILRFGLILKMECIILELNYLKILSFQKNAREGESRVRVIIGTHDKIEKIEILKYTDEKTRKAIEDVFRLKELNT